MTQDVISQFQPQNPNVFHDVANPTTFGYSNIARICKRSFVAIFFVVLITMTLAPTSLHAKPSKTEDELISESSSPKDSVAVDALQQLERDYPDSTNAISAVKKALTDPRTKVHCKAARVLGALHVALNQDEMNTINVMLQSKNPDEVKEAQKALSAFAAEDPHDPIFNLGMPSPGKSKVVFLRDSNFGGNKYVPFRVHDWGAGQFIGLARSNTYFVYECDPGHHMFTTSMENLAVVKGDLLPDRIYYVKIEGKIGVLFTRVDMLPVYPGCHDFNWPRMAKILAGYKNTSKEHAEDDTKYPEGTEDRMNKHSAKIILPEYGQTTPLSAR
jgi:hypothetical protein